MRAPNFDSLLLFSFFHRRIDPEKNRLHRWLLYFLLHEFYYICTEDNGKKTRLTKVDQCVNGHEIEIRNHKQNETLKNVVSCSLTNQRFLVDLPRKIVLCLKNELFVACRWTKLNIETDKETSSNMSTSLDLLDRLFKSPVERVGKEKRQHSNRKKSYKLLSMVKKELACDIRAWIDHEICMKMQDINVEHALGPDVRRNTKTIFLLGYALIPRYDTSICNPHRHGEKP